MDDEYARALLERVRSQIRNLNAEVMGIKSERANYPEMLNYLHTVSEMLDNAPSVYDVSDASAWRPKPGEILHALKRDRIGPPDQVAAEVQTWEEQTAFAALSLRKQLRSIAAWLTNLEGLDAEDAARASRYAETLREADMALSVTLGAEL